MRYGAAIVARVVCQTVPLKTTRREHRPGRRPVAIVLFLPGIIRRPGPRAVPQVVAMVSDSVSLEGGEFEHAAVGVVGAGQFADVRDPDPRPVGCSGDPVQASWS